MKLEISNRLSIWSRRRVCLVHYECSEIMSQDGGCHLGVESGHQSPHCHYGHNGHCGLLAWAQMSRILLQSYLISCRGPGVSCTSHCRHDTRQSVKMLSVSKSLRWWVYYVIMYLLLQQLQWSLYMQRGLLQQQGSNLEQLPTHCSILQGCAVTTQNVSHIQNVCLH